MTKLYGNKLFAYQIIGVVGVLESSMVVRKKIKKIPDHYLLKEKEKIQDQFLI